jgi:hypothetical protein
MTAIYVHPSAVGLPGAADTLGNLVETGHSVVLLGDVTRALAQSLPASGRAAEVPIEIERGSWFVTADPETCRERRTGIQTLLIGPRAAPSARPGPRCDVEARDLASAVLEILRRDVMG